MSVLDELREQIRDLYPEYRDRPSFTDGLYAALNIIDSFEAAHPGLVDKTIPCPRCGVPTVLDGRHKERRLGYWREVCPACAEVTP